MKRKQIAFMFLLTYKNWAGGLIYIINLVSALNLLEDNEKPEILIVHGPESPIDDIKSTGYPYLKFMKVNTTLSFPERIYNKAFRSLFKKSRYCSSLPDIVYPYENAICLGKRPIYWIPDFQDRHLPEMFSAEELFKRKRAHDIIAKSQGKVVFSSEDAMNDFKRLYPEYKCRIELLKFACILPTFDDQDIDALKVKHRISQPYFMSPNQFWKHKNHIVVLQAAKLLKDKGADFQIAFSGNENDHRNKDYFQTLRTYIDKNDLHEQIRFLGFLDRSEQLTLMNNALCIIQPSFFEGWSTVVEDAKALNQFIVLSNIAVHQEQIKENCLFFDPKSPEQLATQLERILETNPERKILDYHVNVQNFSRSIMKVLEVT